MIKKLIKHIHGCVEMKKKYFFLLALFSHWRLINSKLERNYFIYNVNSNKSKYFCQSFSQSSGWTMVIKGALIGSPVNKITVLLMSLLAAKRKGHKPSN